MSPARSPSPAARKPAQPAAASALGWKPWLPGEGGRVLLIAEIANAHEGDADKAERMTQAAAEAGCGAVKFQKYYAEEMLAQGHKMMATFQGWEWDAKTWTRLIESARKRGLLVFADVFGLKACRSLAELPPLDGLKVHGADIANEPLLSELAKTELPILIGTGGSSDWEIHEALSLLGKPERLALLHGFQAFPTPLEETALARIPHLAQSFGVAVGLSDHLDAELSFAKALPLLALPLGVCCVEKHMTLDRSAKGVDHQSALNPGEMKELALWLRQAEAARGEAGLPKSALEEGYRKRFKKSLLAAREIPPRRKLELADLALRMAEAPPRHTLSWSQALGRACARKIPAGTVLSWKDLGAKAGLCLIARLKSTRLPRKALANIHGRSAIERLFSRAKLCKAAERAVLCTSTTSEDTPLVEAARKAGLDAYAGSPEEPLERLIACADAYAWDYAIRATGDNIFLDPELLAQALELALDQNLDYVSMFKPPVGTHCEIVSVRALRALRSHARASFTTEYLTWFLAGNPNFRCADLPIPAELSRSWRLTLDTPEDLENIRAVVALLGKDNDAYTLRELVRAVESDPALEKRLRMPAGLSAPPEPVRFDWRVRPTEPYGEEVLPPRAVRGRP